MAPSSKGDWSEWSNYVLTVLEQLTKDRQTDRRDMEQVHVEIAILKLKASFFGFLAGLGSSLITLAVEYLRRRP